MAGLVPKKNVRNVVRILDPFDDRMKMVRLNKNERNIPFSEEFMDRLRKGLTSELMQTYPELQDFYRIVARWAGVKEDQLLFNLGSDQNIKAVFETYIEEGDEIILHKPGYAMTGVYVTMFGGKARMLERDEELNFDMEKYIGMINENTRMVVIENPNGFDGTAPGIDNILRIIKKARECDAIVLVDEAYHFLSDNPSAAQFINEYDNLIVVRTFSKAFGLASLRAGYTLSQKENIENMIKVRPDEELGGMAYFVISEMMKTPEVFEDYWRINREALQYLKDEFTGMGLKIADSKGNFLAVRLGEKMDTKKFGEEARKRGYLIGLKGGKLSKWIRITTSDLETERKFIEDAKEILQGEKGT